MKNSFYLVLLSLSLALLSGDKNFSAASHAVKSATRVFHHSAGKGLRKTTVRKGSDNFDSWAEVEAFLSTYTNKRDDELCPVPNTEALDECCYRTCKNNHICAPTDGFLYDSCHKHSFQLSEDCLFRKIECCAIDACNQEKCASYEYPNWQTESKNETFDHDIFCDGFFNLSKTQCFRKEELNETEAIYRGVRRTVIEELNKMFSQHLDVESFRVVFADTPPSGIVELSRFIGGEMSGAMEEVNAPVSVRKNTRSNDINVWVRVYLSFDNQRNSLRNEAIWKDLFHPPAHRKARDVIQKHWVRPFNWEAYYMNFKGPYQRPENKLQCWFQVRYKVALNTRKRLY